MSASEIGLTSIKNGLQWIVAPIRVLDHASSLCEHCGHFLSGPLTRLLKDPETGQTRYSSSWWHVAGRDEVRALGGVRPCGDPSPLKCRSCGDNAVLPTSALCSTCEDAAEGAHL